MDVAEFRNSVRGAWELLHTELGIARAVSSLSSLQVDTQFNDIALNPASSYQEIYLAAVSRSYYNIILQDYSIYQFSWMSPLSWRFAYLPNPWIAGVEGASELVDEWETLEGLGAYDQEEIAMLISELPYYGSIPPIRFEYAVDQYREMSHPCAHFHVGRHSDNRWASSRHLNPLSFVMMVTRLYYIESWAPRSKFFDDSCQSCLDVRLIQELERSGCVHDFTQTEKMSLHISAR